MAQALDCPICALTTRVSDALYTRKVRGHRVKILCKGCGQHMVVDATTTELRITPFHVTRSGDAPSRAARGKPPRRPPAPGHTRSSASRLAPAAPTVVAPPLLEDELPTLPRNELPEDEAFLSPVAGSAPPAAWSQSFPPIDSSESVAALFARAPRRRGRVAVLAVAAVCLVGAGAWAARSHPAVVDLMAQALQGERGGPSAQIEKDARDREPTKAGALPVAEPAQNEVRSEGSQPEGGVVAEGSFVGASDAVSSKPAVARKDVAPPVVVQTAARIDSPAKGDAALRGPGSSPPAKEEVENVASPLGPFDREAAAASLRVAEGQASTCRGAGDPSGTARVVVTFAPSGRVTSATVSGPPFAGTPAGGCVASRFRSARVPQYEGSYVTVTKTVVLR